MARHWIERELQAGPAREVDGLTVTPVSQRLHLRIPGVPLALTWQRPRHVLVKAHDGGPSQLPIRDHTRRWQVGLLALGILGSALLLLRRERPANSTTE